MTTVRQADYILNDPEVEDLVENLNNVTIVIGEGDFDLDTARHVLISLVLDKEAGNRPYAAMAVSQDRFATKNSVMNHADSLLRSWYLENNKAFVESRIADGREFDVGWEAMVWDLSPDAANEALDKAEESSLNGVAIDRDFGE